MREFLLIFRRDYRTLEIQPTTDEMRTHMDHWREWCISLAIEGKLARPVQRWDPAGRVLRKNMTVEMGCYEEGCESLRGMIFIRAANYDHAVAIAQRAPVLELGGTVEVRMSV